MGRVYVSDVLNHTGKEIVLSGWVSTIRDHGKVMFVDLRDRSGLVQCVISDQKDKLTAESVISVTGTVQKRPQANENKDLETGTVEIIVRDYTVLNSCKELPIPVEGDGYEIGEDMRLKYRYLDLRRERMWRILKLRSDFTRLMRQGLHSMDFIDVETPMLTKGTTEGSRNFVVPSRMNPGKFYALPQSPQQYKQLLMTSGVERYFQIARCIRDEDLKVDRGFEFTQVDLEMSFVAREDVMKTVEKLVKDAVKGVGGTLKDDPFPVIDYSDALKTYGSDKFDLRTDDEKDSEQQIFAFAWVINFPFFKKVDKKNTAELEDARGDWVFTHNPFSRPIEEHIPWHLEGKNIDKILTTQYDLVCNGYEVGGGSIRAHEPEVLRATYRIMGYSDEEVERTIGHMLEAFELGTPPHGGIALGLDRLVMILAGEESLKEVIPFPMTGTGKTSIMDAPSEVGGTLLKELGIKVMTGEPEGVFINLKRLLDSEGVRYKVIEHRPVKTSEEAALVRGTQMDMAPKAMILRKAGGTLVMVCVPADRQVDLEKTAKILGEKVSVASPEDVEQTLGIKVGAVPPFGSLFGLETYIDRDFWKRDEVVFNAGRRDRSIRMKAKDLIAVAKPNNISESSDFKK